MYWRCGMPRMRLATMVSAGSGPRKVADLARSYEEVGVDIISVPEAYGFDAVSRLGYLAAVTERVELMAEILPIYSRTPTLTAMTAAGLDRLTDGRFILGLGVSGPQVVEGWHGVPFDAPLARTRDIIEICRSVWRRDRVEHHGSHYSVPLPAGQGTGLGKPLKLIDHPVRPAIPASIADGWIPFLYIPERADAVWGDALARGRAKRVSALAPLEIVAGGPMAIGADVSHLRERDRPHLALYIGGMGARGRNFYNSVARQYGYEKEAAEIQDLYLDGLPDEAAARVPDALL